MAKKKKFALFKVPIMAVNKMFGVYSGMPTYGMKSLLVWVFFGLPFLPIFKSYLPPEDEITNALLVIYFPLYILQTFFLGRYISKLGRQWTIKEYEQLKTDQVTFPFLFVLGVHCVFHFMLFSLIHTIVFSLI